MLYLFGGVNHGAESTIITINIVPGIVKYHIFIAPDFVDKNCETKFSSKYAIIIKDNLSMKRGC